MEDRGTDEDPIAQMVRAGVSPGCRVTSNDTWLVVTPGDPPRIEHGWKLHVSSRAATFPGLVEIILPALAAAGCAFKLARSQQVLARLNDGLASPASVGKAVTVYPDQSRVRELGLRLAELLEGQPGPRILSDRQVRGSAPVYYRYGPFTAGWEYGPRGMLALTLHGPGGETFDGAAALGYRQPSWVIDPFTEQAAGHGHPGETDVVGGHYRVTGGLREAAGGNTYTAVDERDADAVVVKQARAMVSEDGRQADTRMRLRNERRVLQALDGVPGIPRLVDHFRHAEDEFLVISDCGPANLAQDVLANGPYWVDEAAGPRRLGVLAAELARILRDVHDRGVIMRDLSPKNIVVGTAGVSIVDFGIAACDGFHLDGATPGYAPARQFRAAPPVAADDYYALGMTLLFAATGLDPVQADDDPELPRSRALQTIRFWYGQSPPAVIGAVADLIGDDETLAGTAFLRLAGGQPDKAAGPARPLPAVPVLSPQTAAEVADSLLADLLKDAERLLDNPPSPQAARDASIYNGSAGIGLELLHHLAREPVPQVVEGLAAFSVQAAARAKLPPGLFAGSTGVSIFLREAAAWGIKVPDAASQFPGPGWEPESDDLLIGAAGTGLGHLLLGQSGDPAHRDVALRCGDQIMSGTTPDSPPPDSSQPITGLDRAAGRAHGLAGVTEFLLALAAQTGDELILAAAAQRAGQLARRTQPLLQPVRQLTAPPLAVSWCNGLAGIGPVLLLASTALQDAALGQIAREAASACIGYVPRISALGRCCGAAGVGSFFIELAIAGQDERYWHAAGTAGVQILLRGGGTPSHPVFTLAPGHHSAGWGFGLAGLLSFFRRLAHRGGPDCLPPSIKIN